MNALEIHEHIEATQPDLRVATVDRLLDILTMLNDRISNLEHNLAQHQAIKFPGPLPGHRRADLPWQPPLSSALLVVADGSH